MKNDGRWMMILFANHLVVNSVFPTKYESANVETNIFRLTGGNQVEIRAKGGNAIETL